MIATAIVFFRRFYIKNAYCETDPFVVIAACCYVAGKAEESPVHIKTVVAEARLLFSRVSFFRAQSTRLTPFLHAEQPFGVKTFPSDNSKLAEMEFYLVADLECDLTVFHPYRTLTALCKKESADDSTAEAGEVGTEVGDGPRYWGTGEGQLELSDDALQLAWYGIPFFHFFWFFEYPNMVQVPHQRHLPVRPMSLIPSTPARHHGSLSNARSTRPHEGPRPPKIILKCSQRRTQQCTPTIVPPSIELVHGLQETAGYHRFLCRA